jgi:hypothetical protein
MQYFVVMFCDHHGLDNSNINWRSIFSKTGLQKKCIAKYLDKLTKMFKLDPPPESLSAMQEMLNEMIQNSDSDFQKSVFEAVLLMQHEYVATITVAFDYSDEDFRKLWNKAVKDVQGGRGDQGV